MSKPITINTARDRRLAVRVGGASRGGPIVTTCPEYRDSLGAWRAQHSGISVRPGVARILSRILSEIADQMDGSTPPEPQPTDDDRAATRWP